MIKWIIGYIFICLAGFLTGYICNRVNWQVWLLGCIVFACGYFLFVRKWLFFHRADIVSGRVSSVRTVRDGRGHCTEATVSFVHKGESRKISSRYRLALTEPTIGQTRKVGVDPQKPSRAELCALNWEVGLMFIGLVMLFGALCCQHYVLWIFCAYGLPIGLVLLASVDAKNGKISQWIYLHQAKQSKNRQVSCRKKTRGRTV